VAWNCRQRFNDNADALLGLLPDIAVVPECADQPARAGQPGVPFVWSGESSPKGLGVTGFNGWVLNCADGPRMSGVLPLVVSGPGTRPLMLLAVWTKKKLGSSYTSQVADVVEVWGDRFGERAVDAGNFNASVLGLSAKRDMKNVERLGKLGMRSVGGGPGRPPTRGVVQGCASITPQATGNGPSIPS